MRGFLMPPVVWGKAAIARDRCIYSIFREGVSPLPIHCQFTSPEERESVVFVAERNKGEVLAKESAIKMVLFRQKLCGVYFLVAERNNGMVLAKLHGISIFGFSKLLFFVYERSL